MAYQFADGFDNYGNGTNLLAGYPWDAITGGNFNASTADFRFAPPGATAGGCIVGSAASVWIRKNLTGNPGTLIVGFGFKLTNLPSSSQVELCTLYDTGTAQVSLVLNSNGALQFYRGLAGGTPIGAITANATIAGGAWYGVAMQITVASGTSGSVQLFINGSGTPAITSSGLNTQATGNAFATQIAIGSTFNNGQGATKFDDFYCLDTTGGFLNSLLGSDARIITKMPASAGNYTNWTPTGLATNWQNAANVPPNASDYNANNTPATKDSYTMQLANLSVAPYFVLERASLERDDAGPHTPSLFVRSSATDSAGVVTPAITSAYQFYDAIFQNDPATSAAWTGTAADNAQAGIIEG